MTTAKDGDKVAVHYRGTLDDGSEFDSSHGRDPLEFTLGSGMVIGGFDSAVSGMGVGDKKQVTFPAEEAYGPHRPEMVQQVERDQIPDHIELAVGAQLQASRPGEQPTVLTIVSFDDASVTLDANHPLAGQALTFDLELVSIN